VKRWFECDSPAQPINVMDELLVSVGEGRIELWRLRMRQSAPPERLANAHHFIPWP
jgi:hypothetical protein